MPHTQENSDTLNRISRKSKETTILLSPFIMSKNNPQNEMSVTTPLLVPQKRKHSSPIKRHRRNSSSMDNKIDMNIIHARNRKPLNFSSNTTNINGPNTSLKKFSLLDDFQHGDVNETIDIFSTPKLVPPQNLNHEILVKQKIDSKGLNRNIFDIGSQNSSHSTNHTNANFSIFSLLPTKGTSDSLDFNSYLRSITSSLQMVPKVNSIDNKESKISKLLDFKNPIKLDVLQENDRTIISDNNIMDDMELDCVVRSSVWDSDAETEEDSDLNLNLNLNLNKDTNDRYNINNSNDDYMKYFNQSIAKSPSQISPIQRSPISSRISITNNNISSFAEPVSIFSDSQSKVQSPVSSRGSDETLHDDELLDINQKKRILNFSTNIEEGSSNLGPAGNKSSPHHHISVGQLKSALKPIPKTLLNLIVESSDGSLEDATKYATEINAQNSEGIPIPEKTTELVNIPTTAPSVNGIHKSAIVRGVRARSGGKKKSKKQVESPILSSNNILGERNETIIQANENRQNILLGITDKNFKGFYSLQEKDQFSKGIVNNSSEENYDRQNKENIENRYGNNMSVGYKRAKIVRGNNNSNLFDINGHKRVNWADNLEW
ncbi:hypothetical protein C6P40_000148 [Pichia californica]|uniref:Uncharacterized protein n=1 Tax=Pichia californica TaxID=460514 RepID=A0A9P6WL87_9ASCO|nr:hypothetical protein C6P42_000249 [[Candida] californica]KAG0689082.1 hypothetical protein C6P40_000148 [[Candida] californica]